MGMALGGLQTLGACSRPRDWRRQCRRELARLSDRRLKTDITKVGTHPSGIAYSRLSLQGRPEDLPESGRADGRGRCQAFRPGGGGEDPRLWRQDGGSPGDYGRAGCAPRPSDGSPDFSDVDGRAADARPQPGGYRRRKAPDGRNGPANPRRSMGGPRMPGPNLAAIASGGMGPLAGPKPMRARRLRMPQLRGALSRWLTRSILALTLTFGDPLAKFRAALAAQGIQTNIFSGVRDSQKQAKLYANCQAGRAGQAAALSRTWSRAACRAAGHIAA